MKIPFIQALTIAGMLFVNTSTASTFMFAPIEFAHGGITSPYLDPILIGMEIREHDGGVDIMISNTSDLTDEDVTNTKPVVTGIYFEDTTSGTLLGGGGSFVDPSSIDTPNVSIITAGGEGLEYGDSVAKGNLPGGQSIGFTTHFSFTPASPVSKKGIDPGETASLRFVGVTGGAAAVVNAIMSSQIRVGLHIQQIGPNAEYSAGYANNPTPILIPEPSSSLLLAIGVMLAIGNRRRQAH